MVSLPHRAGILPEGRKETSGIERTSAATSAQRSDYARTRAVNLAGLAGSYARAGDTNAAVSIGRRALEEIGLASSRRA